MPCIILIAKIADDAIKGATYLVHHVAQRKRDELSGALQRAIDGQVSVHSGAVNGTAEELHETGHKLKSKKEIRQRY